MKKVQTPPLYVYTVKLGNKERLNKEQLGNSKPFSVTNIPVYLINSERIGIILVKNFAMTKKFLITKFDFTSRGLNQVDTNILVLICI